MESWQTHSSICHHSLALLAEYSAAPRLLMDKFRVYLTAVDTPYSEDNRTASYNDICNIRFPHSYRGNLFESAFDLHIFLNEINSTVIYDCERREAQVEGNMDRVYNGVTTQIKYRPLINNKLRLRPSDYDRVELVVYFTYLDDVLVMIANSSDGWKDMVTFKSPGAKFVDREIKHILGAGGKIIPVHPAVAQCVEPLRTIEFPYQEN